MILKPVKMYTGFTGLWSSDIPRILRHIISRKARSPETQPLHKAGNKLYELTSLPLRNKGCGYLEKFAQGCEASPVDDSAPELVTSGP